MKFTFQVCRVAKNSTFSRLRLLTVLIVVALLIILSVEINTVYSGHNCLADPPNCKDFTGVPLLSVDYIEPSEKSIFFLEDHSHQFISPRVLCAVESAAITNPKKDIYLLTTSPKIYQTPALVGVIGSADNIHFGYLDPQKLFSDTPLYQWYKNKRWMESNWPVYHFSDAIRWLMLWVYGGVYMDTDVILMRELPNSSFVAIESKGSIGAGAVGLPPKHQVLTQCINEIGQNYNPRIWGSVGPDLLTNALFKLCGKVILEDQSGFCPDISVLKSKSFYPIHWKNWKQYYETEKIPLLFNDKNIYGLHVWNALSKDVVVNLNEQTPYTIAATRFCPTVVKNVKDKM